MRIKIVLLDGKCKVMPAFRINLPLRDGIGGYASPLKAQVALAAFSPSGGGTIELRQ